MNPVYDTVLGEPVKRGAYKESLGRKITPVTNTGNWTDGLSQYEINNLAANSGIIRKDPSLMEADPEYANGGEYDTFDSLDDSFWSSTGKRMSRFLGHIVGKDHEYVDQNGNAINVPYVTTRDPFTGDINTTPSAVEIAQTGDLGTILDNMKSTRGIEKATYGISPIDERFEVRSYFTPVFDENIGSYVLQEVVGSGNEIEKRRIAGEQIVNQYGPKSLSENVLKSFGKNVVNSTADVFRTLHSTGTAASDLGESFVNLVTDGKFESDYGRSNAYSDYWRWMNTEQDYLAKGTYRSEAESIFDNPESFAAGLGSGVGSLVQYAGLGRLSSLADKAGRLIGLADGSYKASMLAAGLPLNFGEAYDEAKQAGLSLEDSAIIGLVTGGINSYIETALGANVFEKWMVGGSGVRNAARTIIEETGGDVSKLANQAVKDNILRKISSAATEFTGRNVLGSAVEEGSEEIVQGMIKNSMQGLYDSVFADSDVEGEGYFGTNPFSWESIRQNLEEGVIGSVLGGAGSIRANMNERKAKAAPLVTYVARNEENSLLDGATQALNSGAITQQQYDDVSKDITDLVAIRDNNMQLFGTVANYKPEYRGKVAETILDTLNTHKTWIEVNKDGNISDLNREDNVTKDYINSLEELAQSSIISTIKLGEDQSVNIPVSTIDSLVENLRNNGKTAEADMISLASKDASKKASRVIKQAKQLLNQTEPDVRNEARYRLLTDTKNSLTSLNLSKVFNQTRMKVLNNDTNRFISESNSTNPGELSNIHNRFQTDMLGDYNDLANTIKNVYNPDRKETTKRPEEVQKIISNIDKKLNKILSDNKSVSMIDDYVNSQKLTYKFLADNIMIDSDIDLILDRDTNKDIIDDYNKQVEKDRELEIAGNKESVELDTPKPKESTLPERMATAELDNLIDASLTPNNLTFTYDGTTVKLSEADGIYKYQYTGRDGKAEVRQIIADSIEEAVEKAKAFLKEDLNKYVNTLVNVNDTKPTNDELADETTDEEQPESERVTANVTSNVQIHKDSSKSELFLYHHVNDPLTTVAGFNNGATFETSKTFDKLPNKNENSKLAIGLFNKINNLNEFNALKEEQKKLIIDYLPIQYSFDAAVKNSDKEVRTIYITDRSSIGNRELVLPKYNTRKYIIEQILSNNKQFKPSNAIVERLGSKFNYTNKQGAERNSKVSDIPALHIIKEGPNYFYNYKKAGTDERVKIPVGIGVADSWGVIEYGDGEVGLKLANRGGTSGHPYLILPGGLSTSGNTSAVKLNPKKVSSKLAESIKDIVIRIAKGEISGVTTVVSDDTLGIKVPEDTTLNYDTLLEAIIPYGEATVRYMNPAAPQVAADRLAELLKKVLYVDQANGLIRYGYNPETGQSYALDSADYSESDEKAFVDWMVANKNMSVSRAVLDAGKLPEFTFQEVTNSPDANYISYLVDNEIIGTDLNPAASSILKDTVLKISFPETEVDSIASVNKTIMMSTPTKAKESTTQIVSSTPTVTTKETDNKVPGRDLTNSVLNRMNNIPENMTNTFVENFLNNLPNGVVAYAAINISLDNFRSLSPSAKRKSFVDVTDYLPDMLGRFAKRDKFTQDLYADIVDELLYRMGLPEGTQVGILSFAKTDVLGIRQTASTDEVIVESENEAKSVTPENNIPVVPNNPEPVTKEEVKTSIEEDFLKFANEEPTQALTNEELANIDNFFEEQEKEYGTGRDTKSLERSISNLNNAIGDYQMMNKNVEKRAYRDMLSSLTGGNIEIQDKIVEILKSSGDVKYAWASMNIDGVILWNGAEEGTLYHEAFHRVSQLYLSNEERQALYKDARKRFNMPTSSMFDLEETLAEDFRSFVLDNEPKRSGLLNRIWNNLKNFIKQFIFGKKPNYTDIQTLFNTIQFGGYQYVRATSNAKELFRKRYPDMELGLEVNGVQMMGIQTTKQFYDITKALTAITLNANGIESMSSKKIKDVDFSEPRSYVINRGRETSTEYKDLDNNAKFTSLSEVEQAAIKSSYVSRINIYHDILRNFDEVFKPAINTRLNALGWESKDLNLELNDEEKRSIFEGVKNDEISSSYEYSAKDTATADIKSLFETLLLNDRINPNTGLPNYAAYDIAWFDAFRKLHDSVNVTEMMTRIKKAGDSIGGVNMYNSLYTKLTGNNTTETLRTRFWVTLKKHRHAFLNTYFRKQGDGTNYYIEDADINKRSNLITGYWSSMFGLSGIYKNTESNRTRIVEATKKWTELVNDARNNRIKSYEGSVNKLIDIFGTFSIELDHNTMNALTNMYRSTSSGEQGKLEQLRSLLLDRDNARGDKLYLNKFFDEFLTVKNEGVIGKEQRINPNTNRNEGPEDYLMSQGFLKTFANKYVEANPAIEDDSILGPEGNNVFAYSEYNFLTQSVEEYFKDTDYINKLKSITYNKKSLWLDALSNPSVNKNNVKVTTALSFLQLDDSDTGRDYVSISDTEDTMLKFNAVMTGRYPIPTLANKRTYYFVEGLPMVNTLIIKDNSTDAIKLDDNTVTLYTDYLKTEYLSTKEAYAARNKFLSDNNITLSQFDDMSESEQDKYDYSNLVVNYHYTNKDGKITLDGNGYKFRYFKTFDGVSRDKLNNLFDPINTSNLKNLVRNALIEEINDTIQFLNELGVIKIEGKIASPNKSIGTDGSNNIVITETPLLDNRHINRYVKQRELLIDTSNISDESKNLAVLNMIADFAINTSVGTIEFEKLVSGDLAFYPNNDTRIKRYSALSSTGLVLRTDWSDTILPSTLYNIDGNVTNEYGISPEDMINYRAIGFKSNIITNSPVHDYLLNIYANDNNTGHLQRLYKGFWESVNASKNPDKYLQFKGKPFEEVMEMAKKDALTRLSGYKKIDQTDAQVLITPEMFRKINISIGEWSDEKERAYQMLESDRDLSIQEELDAYSLLTMQVLKMVYVGPSFENGLSIPVYDKMSLATVFKRMTKGTDLEMIYDNMSKNNIQMLKFESAVKSGGRQSMRFYDKETQKPVDNVAELFANPKYTHSQEFRFLRRQLVTDPHETHDMAAGTQATKIAPAGIIDDADYTLNGIGVKGADLRFLNKSVTDQLTRVGFDEFLKKLDIKNNQINRADLVNFLRKNAIQSNQNNNMIDAFKVDDKGNFVIEPSLLPSMAWVQSRLLSMVKSTVVDTNIKGNAYIQMSNFGFKNSNVTVTENPSYKVNGELAFKNNKNESEIIISMSIVKPFLPKIKGNQIIDGEYEYRDMTYSEALEYVKNSDISLMGYRIPTQGQNMIVPLKIVHILPETAGDTVILPAPFTTLTGSDFDIDKLYVLTHNYYADTKTKQLKKVDYDVRTALNDISKLQKNQLQNLLLDVYLSVLTSDNHVLETTTPLDATTQPIKDVVKILDDFLKDETATKNLRISFPRFQASVKSQNVGADAGIAPMALANVHHQLTTEARIEMNTGVDMKGTPNIVTRFGVGPLYNKYDKNGTLILDWTSALINAHVDAAKDPYILKLNVNRYTYSTTALLVRSGFGLSTFFFMPQPILVNLAKQFERLTTGKLGLTSRELRKINWEKDILKEWDDTYKDLATKEKYSPQYTLYSKEMLNNITDKAFLEKLLTTPEDKRNAEWYYHQLGIAAAYLQLQQYGKALSNMVAKTQIDTAKYGNNATAITLYRNDINNMLASKYFVNASDIFDKTFLGVKKQYSIDTFFDIFGSEFIEMSSGFQDIAENIVKESVNFSSNRERLLNQITNEIKHAITSKFFDDYIKENGYNPREMFYGEESTVAKYKALYQLINTNNQFRSLRGNPFLEMLAPNTTDIASSKKFNKPQLFNTFVMKNKDADSVNAYVSGFRDILIHPNDAVRKLGNELILYAYLTSGGTSGGLNNIMNLVPFDILANLSLNDDITYNDYVSGLIQLYNSNALTIGEINRIKDSVYRSLSYNREIVPNIGSANLHSSNFLTPYNSDYIERVQLQNAKVNTKAKASPFMIMTDYFTTIYYNGTDAVGNPQFQPFISVSRDDNRNEIILYKYVGFIADSRYLNTNGKNGNMKAVYELDSKLGYKDKQYIIKESSENRFVTENRKFNNNDEPLLFQTSMAKQSIQDAIFTRVDSRITSSYVNDIEQNDADPVQSEQTPNDIKPTNQVDTVRDIETTPESVVQESNLDNEPISKRILDNSSSIIAQFTKDENLLPNSFEYGMVNGFRKLNDREPISAEDVLRDMKGLDTDIFVPKELMGMSGLDKPVTILRASEYLDNKVSAGLGRRISNYAEMGYKFTTLNEDVILNQYLSDNGIEYTILDKPAIIDTQVIKVEAITQTRSNNGVEKVAVINYTTSSKSGYPARTKENAEGADATIAFAIDFNSAGEKLTKRLVNEAGKKYIPIDLNNFDTVDLELIVKDLNDSNSKTLNIAGNGIYTLNKADWNQDRIDNFVYDVLSKIVNSPNLKNKIVSVRSGGQTGVDEAGAKAASRLGIPTTIHAPSNWLFRGSDSVDVSDESKFKARFESSGVMKPQQTLNFDDNEKTQVEGPSSFKGQMNLEYGNGARDDIKSKTTLEAVKNYERTAMTRYSNLKEFEYWKNVKIGDIVEFYNVKSGDSVLVRVTSPLTKVSEKLADSKYTANSWSELEGWSIEYFNKVVKPRLEYAYQFEYELIDNSQNYNLNTILQTGSDNLEYRINNRTLEYSNTQIHTQDIIDIINNLDRFPKKKDKSSVNERQLELINSYYANDVFDHFKTFPLDFGKYLIKNQNIVSIIDAIYQDTEFEIDRYFNLSEPEFIQKMLQYELEKRKALVLWDTRQLELPFSEELLQDRKDQMIKYIQGFPQAGTQAQVTIQDINNASNLQEVAEIYQKLCK